VKQFAKCIVENVVSVAAPFIWRAGRARRLLVLMYHRVLPADHPDRLTEQPGMYVSPQTLTMHVRILRQHFEFVDLYDWVRRAGSGQSVPRLACALTFDDGWRDNFEYAFPILRAERVPATIYVLSDLMGTQYSFWPNRLARLLGNSPNNDAYAGWPVWLRREMMQAAGTRVELPLSVTQIDAVIARCKSLQTDDAMLELLRNIDGSSHDGNGDRDLMNWDEARQMLASGLITFGSHTRRHIRLNERTAADMLRDEICESRWTIERQLHTSVNSFCYPNGDHCPAAVELVRAGYSAAVTTRRGWNSITTNPYLLNRVGLHEDVSSTAHAFVSRLTLAAVN